MTIKKYKKKKFAMFNKDKWGNIVGFCNDSFCMTYRYHCVNVWDYPPTHYYNPKNGDFIICLNKKYDDVEVLPLTKKNHTFKGNYLFKQKTILQKGWVFLKDMGTVNIGKK